MKRLIILACCVIAIAFVSITREYRFVVAPKTEEKSLEVKDTSTTLLFVGDVMFGRNVEVLMKKEGRDYPFRSIDSLLKSADKVIANLEGPIMSPHVITPSQSVTFSFASTTAALLRDHNITFVSLANNHMYDHGKTEYVHTKEFLTEAGVQFAGNPYAFGDEYTARVETKNGPVLFFAFNATHPGFDSAKALAFVKEKTAQDTAFAVALVHGGTEYELRSNDIQKKFYRGLIDAGVRAVIAHHPHVVEEIELYKEKPIFYSLGNFIFDQYFSKNVEEGLAVKLTLTDNEARFDVIPLKGNHSQPRVMTKAESETFLGVLAKRSSPILKAGIERGYFVLAR